MGILGSLFADVFAGAGCLVFGWRDARSRCIDERRRVLGMVSVLRRRRMSRVGRRVMRIRRLLCKRGDMELEN